MQQLEEELHEFSQRQVIDSGTIHTYFQKYGHRVTRLIQEKLERITNIDLEVCELKEIASSPACSPIQLTLVNLQYELKQALIEFNNLKQLKLECLRKKMKVDIASGNKSGAVQRMYDISLLKAATKNIRIEGIMSSIKHYTSLLSDPNQDFKLLLSNTEICEELLDEKSRLIAEVDALKAVHS